MALLFVESFDHMTDPLMLTRKWTSAPLASATNIVPARTGNGYNFFATSSPYKTLGPGFGVYSMAAGLAYNTAAFANDPIVLGFLPNGSIALQHVGDGRFQVHLDIAPTYPTSTPSVFTMVQNEWFYLELQATMSGSSMSYVARANGGTILSGTFTGTGLTSSYSFDNFVTGGPGGGYSCIVDDIYVTDGELLGDVRVYCLFPRLDGTTIQWVPSGGTTHFNLVKEHVPDDMATYVSCDSSHINNKDEYYLDLIGAFPGIIKGVQACWCTLKTDAGDASIQGFYDNGSTIIDTSAAINSPFHPSYLSWMYFLNSQRKSVFTGNDWTVAEINAMQLGIQRLL